MKKVVRRVLRCGTTVKILGQPLMLTEDCTVLVCATSVRKIGRGKFTTSPRGT